MTPTPDASLLEAFPTPTDNAFEIEHTSDEFTSVCPVTGHPDFGSVVLRYRPRAGSAGGVCVELKSLKMYYQSFRNAGIYYEAVTNRILDDLVAATEPRRMEVVGDFYVRGGITTQITARYEKG